MPGVRRRRQERGAGSVEYVGITLVGALLATGVLLSPAGGSVATDSMSITDAQYWDGTQWVPWEACNA